MNAGETLCKLAGRRPLSRGRLGELALHVAAARGVAVARGRALAMTADLCGRVRPRARGYLARIRFRRLLRALRRRARRGSAETPIGIVALR